MSTSDFDAVADQSRTPSTAEGRGGAQADGGGSAAEHRACYMCHNGPHTAYTSREGSGQRFPDRDAVAAAAARFQVDESASEGFSWYLAVSPGGVQVRGSRDDDPEEFSADFDPAMVNRTEARGDITGWSRRSRARMLRRLCELDYRTAFEGETLVMVTLTLPGEWRSVCSDGRAFKDLVKAFRKRWVRRYGPISAVWKMEFQRRGAPHVHIMTALPEDPEFRDWLSDAWCVVVGHPDPVQREKHRAAGTGVDFATGMRSLDPKRVGVYFSKHGAYSDKEYQNHPPENFEGVGRFWGYWGLSREVSEVSVSRDDAVYLARLLRRAGAYRWSRDAHGAPVRVRVRARLFRHTSGFHAVNDGPDMSALLARALEVRDSSGPPSTLSEIMSDLDAGVVPEGVPDDVAVLAMEMWRDGRLGAAVRRVLPYYRSS